LPPRRRRRRRDPCPLVVVQPDHGRLGEASSEIRPSPARVTGLGLAAECYCEPLFVKNKITTSVYSVQTIQIAVCCGRPSSRMVVLSTFLIIYPSQ
jgi:hypothetical protein